MYLIVRIEWIAITLCAAMAGIGVPRLVAQSGTSSALAGTIADQSSAVIANARVTATEVNTGASRTLQTNADGRFLFSQVSPGTYRIEVRAASFGTAISQPTSVSVGETATVNFTLSLASTSQAVEVIAQSGLMSLENANTSTTLEAKTIKNLPNPGQDLTYVAQFAEGALMNTAGSSNDAKAAGGYGNVEFNGLPATSNGYILDGFDSNDPFLGLNIGLSTNLVIGLDALAGGDRQHQLLRCRSGPLRRVTGELLHQVRHQPISWRRVRDMEWLFAQRHRLLSPCQRHARQHSEEAALDRERVRRQRRRSDPHEQALLLRALRRHPHRAAAGSSHHRPLDCLSAICSAAACRSAAPTPSMAQLSPREPQEVAFYRNMFALYSNTAGTPTPVLSCPLDANGALLPGTQTAANLFNGSGCANKRTQSLNNSDSENLIVFKIDHTIDAAQQRLVPLPAGHRPAGGVHRPDQPHLQLLLAAAAAHAGRRATRTCSRRIS